MTTKNSEELQIVLDDFDLHEDDLTDEAKHLFPFHTEILKSLNLYGRSILSNTRLTSAGKHLICSGIVRSHKNVKCVLNYLATKPLETKEKISDVPMIVICGLPRTGTTLLHNLMACDPFSRVPLLTDMTGQVIPPISRSNVEEHGRRMKMTSHIIVNEFSTAEKDFEKYRNNICSSHALFPPEEDSLLQADVGIRVTLSVLAPQRTNLVASILSKENKDFSYNYHQIVLQMLHNVDPPETHWQLKSASHTFWLDTLLKYYPQASLIMSHRRLDQVIPSLCSHFLAFNTIYFNDSDSNSRKTILEQTVTILDVCIERLIEFRSRELSPTNVFDIQYEDLMRDPIGTVHRIYDHFHFLKWSDEFEKGMCKWLSNNPQGKQGRHSYSFQKFGLDKETKKDLHEKYEKMFLLN